MLRESAISQECKAAPGLLKTSLGDKKPSLCALLCSWNNVTPSVALSAAPRFISPPSRSMCGYSNLYISSCQYTSYQMCRFHVYAFSILYSTRDGSAPAPAKCSVVP